MRQDRGPAACGARLQACEPACGCEEAWFLAVGVVEEGSRSCVGEAAFARLEAYATGGAHSHAWRRTPQGGRIRTPGGVRHRGGGFARLEACATGGREASRIDGSPGPAQKSDPSSSPDPWVSRAAKVLPEIVSEIDRTDPSASATLTSPLWKL